MADFGSIGLLLERGSEKKAARRTRTISLGPEDRDLAPPDRTVGVGTPHYMSLKALFALQHNSDVKYDETTDVWSFGESLEMPRVSCRLSLAGVGCICPKTVRSDRPHSKGTRSSATRLILVLLPWCIARQYRGADVGDCRRGDPRSPEAGRV